MARWPGPEQGAAAPGQPTSLSGGETGRPATGLGIQPREGVRLFSHPPECIAIAGKGLRHARLDQSDRAAGSNDHVHAAVRGTGDAAMLLAPGLGSSDI